MPAPDEPLVEQRAAACSSTWAAHDRDGFRALLADDVTWQGPTWRAVDAEECTAAFEVAASRVDRVEVVHVRVDGEDALTWVVVAADGGPPRAVANWMTVRDGLVTSVRTTGDLPSASRTAAATDGCRWSGGEHDRTARAVDLAHVAWRSRSSSAWPRQPRRRETSSAAATRAAATCDRCPWSR